MSNEQARGNDVEKPYPTKEVVAKLPRLAEALEQEVTFEIMIAGERIYVPPHAVVEFEYERRGEEEEMEIELKWKRPASPEKASDGS